MNDDYLKLLEQIADQAALVRERQKEYYDPKRRRANSLQNAKKAEHILDIQLGRLAQLRAEIQREPAYVQSSLVTEIQYPPATPSEG